MNLIYKFKNLCIISLALKIKTQNIKQYSNLRNCQRQRQVIHVSPNPWQGPMGWVKLK